MSFNAVEDQIKEARGRAEVFASSLLKAREQEILFDEERQKWVQTFEEKSIMIEQLERELTSTVDALNQEKEEKTFVQKELVQSTWELSNLSLSLEAANQRKEPSPPVPDTSYHMRHDDYVETGASSRRVLELLQQSQEETTQARKELGAVRSERDRLSDQVSAMRRQIDRVSEDRDQLLISLKNSESKLHFRNEQVRFFLLLNTLNNDKSR
jgi:chromosome segregation ATPase